MCGISGYILNRAVNGQHPSGDALLSGIRLRGPDDEGVCLINRRENKVLSCRTVNSQTAASQNMPAWPESVVLHDMALFHARYSIIDISVGGHQPFRSQDGLCTAAYNGEIYNYLELRDELVKEGVVFRTSSDTEVLVEGYRFWKDALWPKLNGFWAVVIYDARDGSVVLSRDRLGVSPLYYREMAEGLFFSSQIEPLKNIAHRPAVNNQVLHRFIKRGVKDVDKRTFYAGIHSLPPAEAIRLRPSDHLLQQGVTTTYWKLPEARFSAADMSFKQATATFRALFFDSVRLRLRSDVSLGFELSGGLDSSSVVAAAAVITGKRLSTYTLRVKGRDEEPFARAMLKKYDLDYRVVSDLEDDLGSQVESFARVMEEPYDTPANYLHHALLERIKSDGISVILTGAGGDETLAGYEASFWPAAYREWRNAACGPWPADWYEFCRRFRSLEQAKITLLSYVRAALRLVSIRRQSTVHKGTGHSVRQSFFAQRRYSVLTAMLPYYLRSTDHYTMSIPIEHRFPFLDYRLVEFGLRLPIEYLFRDGYTKYVLRKAMEPYLPAKLLWRRQKFGFPFAYADYFIGKEPIWGSYLNSAQSLGVYHTSLDYDSMSRSEPLLLWRMISVGVWLQAVEGRR